MQKRTIIIYSSVDGQTKKICCHINNVLILNNHLVDLISVNDLTQQITAFDKIIIASSIRYGKHNEQIEKLIKEN